jgi:hypothetical protein
MRQPLLRTTLAALVALSAAPLRGADGESEAARVAALVGQLGSTNFGERERAMRALDRQGAHALAALRAALRGPDAEVRRRAAELVARIEQRLENERVLRPRRVRLVYKDTPLAEAVADFARQTGFPIRLHGDPARWAGRRVTLDTGDTTYWEALARFGAAAGLAEQPMAPLVASDERFIQRGGGRRILFLEEGRLGPRYPSDDAVLLEDGKPLPGPTYQAGALRLRVLPPTAGPAPGARQVALTLEARTEPGLGWEKVVALRIHGVVDDCGQRLRQAGPYFGDGGALELGAEEVIMVWDGRSTLPTNRGRRHLPINLHLGERPARRLRELHGILGVWVRTPPEVLATVEPILGAARRTVEGRGGTLLKVTEVRREEAGRYRLGVEVTSPPPVSDLVWPALRVIRVNRGVPGKTLLAPKGGNNPFTLLDDRGRPLTLASGEYTLEGDGLVKQFTLTYLSGKDQGQPTRLLYTERRNAFIDVPFVLRDVPLYK